MSKDTEMDIEETYDDRFVICELCDYEIDCLKTNIFIFYKKVQDNQEISFITCDECFIEEKEYYLHHGWQTDDIEMDDTETDDTEMDGEETDGEETKNI
jgi:hypothetical protein